VSERDEPGERGERDEESGAALQRRIVNLELRFMQQERLIEELNQVVVEQQRALERMAIAMRTLQEQVRAGAEAMPKDERPPHY
jgi:SlyX protein